MSERIEGMSRTADAGRCKAGETIETMSQAVRSSPYEAADWREARRAGRSTAEQVRRPQARRWRAEIMARQSGWERRVNQDEKKQPGVGMIVAGGGLGKA